ncbi:MAG: hypothetical protein ACJA0U_002267 [Salibacteraceae bacterium]|jgi:hypothetical protein
MKLEKKRIIVDRILKHFFLNVTLKGTVEVASKITEILSNDASKCCFRKKNAELAFNLAQGNLSYQLEIME